MLGHLLSGQPLFQSCTQKWTWGHTFKQFDYQKERPDSGIFDAESVTAALVGEDLIDETAPPKRLPSPTRKSVRTPADIAE
jgi:hypothetical protein